jgi:hypothetical protein
MIMMISLETIQLFLGQAKPYEFAPVQPWRVAMAFATFL